MQNKKGADAPYLLFEKLGEEHPYLVSSIHVVHEPRMPTPNNLIQPYFAVVYSTRKTVFYDGIVIGSFSDNSVGFHERATVSRHTVMYSKGYRHIFTPSSLVVGISKPGRSLVLGAMYFKGRPE